jgi:glucose-1-phosphate adenylyltransferase
MDEESRITELIEKPLSTENKVVSCGIYVIRRRLLISMLEDCAAEDRSDFVNDILIRYIRMRKVFGYMHNEFWSAITSIDTYYHTNMAFLRPDIRKYFFETEPRIYTRIGDRPPAKYNEHTCVSNSLISVDCIINGEVRDSLLFQSVYVGENTRIKDCIILNDVYIGDNVQLEKCIVESHSTILPGTSYLRDEEIKVIAEANNRYDI